MDKGAYDDRDDEDGQHVGAQRIVGEAVPQRPIGKKRNHIIQTELGRPPNETRAIIAKPKYVTSGM